VDLTRLVIDTLALRSDAFATVLAAGRPGMRLALLVVFFGGLSTALGQSVILFANRVSPRRFLASLLVQAVLFVLAFVLWVAAVWLVAGLLLDRPLPFAQALTAVGLAHAPLLLGFLVLAPYFGAAIANLLSIWTLLATLLATATAYDLAPGGAALAAGLGWLLSQLAQRTVGRPITRLGRALRHAVAGVELERARAP
jgi:hypothetical protein